ncbi:MAG: hypothetical protein QS721_05260 [Candidatus Endonucleobacter sp. (ex Gigantidas childressi)]|nr:hypothetical protein [Candidatus Endonucleobacter sp. (ex Gigantidas childressi)]
MNAIYPTITGHSTYEIVDLTGPDDSTDNPIDAQFNGRTTNQTRPRASSIPAANRTNKINQTNRTITTTKTTTTTTTNGKKRSATPHAEHGTGAKRHKHQESNTPPSKPCSNSIKQKNTLDPSDNSEHSHASTANITEDRKIASKLTLKKMANIYSSSDELWAVLKKPYSPDNELLNEILEAYTCIYEKDHQNIKSIVLESFKNVETLIYRAKDKHLFKTNHQLQKICDLSTYGSGAYVNYLVMQRLGLPCLLGGYSMGTSNEDNPILDAVDGVCAKASDALHYAASIPNAVLNVATDFGQGLGALTIALLGGRK